MILLDEPTAGMSKSETTRFIELIREVTVGKTLLTVEHDMGVVFGLADKIAVLVYGEIIAFDTPETRARQPRGCRKPISVRPEAGVTCACSRSSGLHAYYGKSHVLHGVTFDVGEGEIVACSAATARAARPRLKAIMGLVRRTGSMRLRDGEILGRKPYEIAHRGHRLRAGEPRHLPQAHGAPEPAARRRSAARERAALVVRRHVRDVPAAEGAPAHRSRRALGRRAADADAVPHADGRPAT